jgi:phytoene synthase
MLLSSPETVFATDADHAACREAIRQGSRSFHAASMLLPSAVRRSAFGLYAFCRYSDDAIDLGGGSLHALERLRERLERIYSGQPLPSAADRSMADVVRRHSIPFELPSALMEGLEWDARGRRFETLSELCDYAARVAATVGAMMTLIMGVRAPDVLARACDLGVAMQLTNIARDVGEDARAGRIYLPLEWLREEVIDVEAFVQNPQPSPALNRLIARLLGEAERLYRSAQQGIAGLPATCRPAILTAAKLYAEIGREVERSNYDSVTRRAYVDGKKKLQLLLLSLAQTPALRMRDSMPALEEVRFLIDAVERSPVVMRMHAAQESRAVRVLAIFEKLERNRRFGEQLS